MFCRLSKLPRRRLLMGEDFITTKIMEDTATSFSIPLGDLRFLRGEYEFQCSGATALAMNNVAKKVKMYACKNATNNSRNRINRLKTVTGTPTPT